MDTEIRVSTESRPWRRKFSRRSNRDSNPRPFNHESGALTTELSPPPGAHFTTTDAFVAACRGVQDKVQDKAGIVALQQPWE